MATYIVRLQHTVNETYEVEAHSWQEAVDAVEDGDVDPVDTDYIESHVLDTGLKP